MPKLLLCLSPNSSERRVCRESEQHSECIGWCIYYLAMRTIFRDSNLKWSAEERVAIVYSETYASLFLGHNLTSQLQ